MALKWAQETSSRHNLRSVISPYNSVYTQAVAYTTYFALGTGEQLLELMNLLTITIDATIICKGHLNTLKDS